jgi:hypothetical protein
MKSKKLKKKEFKITAKSSSLSKEEKKELLWQCFDILFGDNPEKKKKLKNN